MARRGTIFIPDNTYYLTFTILGWHKLFINDKYKKYWTGDLDKIFKQ